MQDTKLKKKYLKEPKVFFDARFSQHKILVIITAAFSLYSVYDLFVLFFSNLTGYNAACYAFFANQTHKKS